MRTERVRQALTSRITRLHEQTLPHVTPRPVEFLRPDILWRGHRLAGQLRAADLTIVTPRRARNLYRLARAVDRRKVPGAIVDCGVRNGGSTMLMSEGAPERDIWAFDSFEGLPAPTAMDGEGPLPAPGAYRGSIEAIEAGFRTYGNRHRLRIVEGWFENTLDPLVADIGPIAILHIDADFYEPVKLALETFYPSVSPGGYVILDDYFSFPGARRATDEVRAQYRARRPLVGDHYWRV